MYRLDKTPDKNFIVLGSFYQCDIPLYGYPKRRVRVVMPQDVSYDLLVQVDPRSRTSRIEFTSFETTRKGCLSSGKFSIPDVKERPLINGPLVEETFLPEYISLDSSSAPDPLASIVEAPHQKFLDTETNAMGSKLLKECKSPSCSVESWLRLFDFEQGVYVEGLCRAIRLKLTTSSFLSEVDRIKIIYASKGKIFFKDALEMFPDQEAIVSKYLEFVAEFEISPFEEIFPAWVSFISFSSRKKDPPSRKHDIEGSSLRLFFNFCKRKASFSSFSTLFGLFSTLIKEKEKFFTENGNANPLWLFLEISSFVSHFLIEYGYTQRAYLISLMYSRLLLQHQRLETVVASIMEDSILKPSVVLSEDQNPSTMERSFDPWAYLRDAFLKNKSYSTAELLDTWLHVEKYCMQVHPSPCLSKLDLSSFSKISFTNDLYPLMISFSNGIGSLNWADFEIKEYILLQQLRLCGLSIYQHYPHFHPHLGKIAEMHFLTLNVIDQLVEFVDAKATSGQTYWEELSGKKTARQGLLSNIFHQAPIFSPLSLDYGTLKFTLMTSIDRLLCNGEALAICLSQVCELALGHLHEGNYLDFTFWICLHHDIQHHIMGHDCLSIIGSLERHMSYLDNLSLDSNSPSYLTHVRAKLLLRCRLNFFHSMTTTPGASLTSFVDLTSQIYASMNEELLYLFLSIKIKNAHMIGRLADAPLLSSVLGIIVFFSQFI